MPRSGVHAIGGRSERLATRGSWVCLPWRRYMERPVSRSTSNRFSIRSERLTTVKRHFWAVSLWILLPMSLAAGTTKIYVLNNAGSTVDVIDAATNTVVQSIYHIWMPHAVTFSADGTRAYITSEIQDAVFVVDTKTAKVIKKVDLGKHIPNVPVISKDGKKLYVCTKIDGPRDETMHFNQGGGSLDIIDT